MSPRAIVAKSVQALTHESTVSVAFALVLIGAAFVAGQFSNKLGNHDSRILAVEQLANDTAKTLANVAATVNEISKRLDREGGS